uniref:RRM domain-containing protein n=1 Tax=Alexandrium andersonii TaxID=327968 RepID=A0A7S2F2V0_9DINO|mmetsp:Transcript_13745/g.31151  ORF Transcript_13745/g.31151 Transcript_13745/m.31151 type:complete len:516 (+) Transcript_13745:2-1549(+)
MAMMAMAAAAGGVGTGPGLTPGLSQAGLPQAPGAELGGAAPFPPAGMDPAMAAQAYAQMFSYFQQSQAPPPFPTMGSMYTPPAAPTPAISVSVDGMKFQYQLTEDDLHKVFSRYGAVKQIRVDEAGTTAQIAFQDFNHAQAAMSDLNGKVLNGLEGTLRLGWAAQGAPAALPPPFPCAPNPMMPPLPGWGLTAPGAAAWPGAAPTMAPAMGAIGPPASGDPTAVLGMGCPVPPAALGSDLGGAASAGSPDAKAPAPAHVKGVRKYTCRFLIGIDNDKEFQVVRRIIGAKGTNMKRIVKQTEAKLRLRGVGSGYFEGAGQRESSEPLQLCVSCTSADGYRTAVRLVEELLENVYSEYRQVCRDNGRPEPDLHASPQLVSAGGRGHPAVGGAGGGGEGASSGGAGSWPAGPSGGGGGGDSDAGEGNSPDDKRDSRRRARRPRAKKGEVERGEPPPKAPPVDDIEKMIDQRNEARRQCNFSEADRIRQSLHERGVALMDEPGARGKGTEVTTWRYWRE